MDATTVGELDGRQVDGTTLGDLVVTIVGEPDGWKVDGASLGVLVATTVGEYVDRGYILREPIHSLLTNFYYQLKLCLFTSCRL